MYFIVGERIRSWWTTIYIFFIYHSYFLSVIFLQKYEITLFLFSPKSFKMLFWTFLFILKPYLTSRWWITTIYNKDEVYDCLYQNVLRLFIKKPHFSDLVLNINKVSVRRSLKWDHTTAASIKRLNVNRQHHKNLQNFVLFFSHLRLPQASYKSENVIVFRRSTVSYKSVVGMY